jgi:ferredoxin
LRGEACSPHELRAFRRILRISLHDFRGTAIARLARMSIQIGDTCIYCAACEEECPVEAIAHDENDVYRVDAAACTRCQGEYEKPKCIEVCPIEDCIVDAAA